MTSSEILKREVESLKQDLIAKHNELKMKASGKWIESLETVVVGNSSTILSAPYTKQLADGRKPGKFPPLADIEEWIIDKGIKPLDDKITLSSLAFLIARSIAKKGTLYFQQGGTKLVSAVITPERVQSIIDKVTEFSILKFEADVTSIFMNSIVK